MKTKNLYIHIPFCDTRCAYCDFVSNEYNADIAKLYIDALGAEFARRAYEMRPETIYVGGGTPTCMSLELLERLFDLLDLLDPTNLKEFTVEANPGTLSMEKLVLLREAGVTRISIGVQSFLQRGLDALGRSHDAKQSRFALAQLREAGFDDISADLIFAWPGQSLDEWEKDLREALRLDIPHLSCYGLTYPSGTKIQQALNEGKIEQMSESKELLLFNMAEEILAAEGRCRYEVSNYSLPGCESMHNINYWQGGSYTGIGAGAHSYEGNTRFGNETNIAEYIRDMNEKGAAISFVDEISVESRARECAAIWLRMKEGIELKRFAEVTNYPLIKLLGREIGPLVEQGLLEWSADKRYLRLTHQAVPIADAVLAEII